MGRQIAENRLGRHRKMQSYSSITLMFLVCVGGMSVTGLGQVLSVNLQGLSVGGSLAILTDDQLDKIVDLITVRCYTDPDLVPAALKKCVGTSANLLRQVVGMLSSSVVELYTSSSSSNDENQELLDQSICFVEGLGLISDDGTLNQSGLEKITNSLKDSADLRIYIQEAIQICANSALESELLPICIQKALLQKCHFVEL